MSAGDTAAVITEMSSNTNGPKNNVFCHSVHFFCLVFETETVSSFVLDPFSTSWSVIKPPLFVLSSPPLKGY